MAFSAVFCDIIVRDYSSDLSHSGGHGAETDTACRVTAREIDMTWSSGRAKTSINNIFWF